MPIHLTDTSNDTPISDTPPFFPNYFPMGLVGYVFEADTYCIKCSEERFGPELQSWVAGAHQQSYPYEKRNSQPPLDSEGNPVSAITGDMEFQCTLHCGDCHTDLGPQLTILHTIPKGKRTCSHCGTNKRDMDDNVYISES